MHCPPAHAHEKTEKTVSPLDHRVVHTHTQTDTHTHTCHVNHRLTYWMGGHNWNGSITRIATVHCLMKVTALNVRTRMQTGYLQHINSTPHHHCWVDRSQVCHACKLQNSPNLYRTDCKHTRSSRHVVFCCVRKPSNAGQTHALIASIHPKDMPVLENCMLANLATAGGWHWLLSNLLDTSGGCPCRYRVKRP